MRGNKRAALWLTTCALIALILAGVGPAAGEPAGPLVTVNLIASADAYVADKQPATRYGDQATMRVGYDPTLGYMQTLVQFNLSDGVPAGVFIEEAILELYVSSASPQFDPPLSTDLYPITEAWSEQLVSWGNRPAIDGVWATAGLGRDPNYYGWNITALVQDWASGKRANHGVMLIADANPLNVRARTFLSRDPLNAFKPRLVVRYTVDTTAPTATVNPLPAYSPKTFTVSWSGSDSGGSGLDYYDVQARANGGAWLDWHLKTGDTSATFNGVAGFFYEFRARAVDRAGNVQPYGGPQAATWVGFATAEVNPFPQNVINTTSFPVSWIGDAHGGAAITRYFIYASFNGGAFAVVPNMNGITGISATFTAAQGDGLYAFQAVAENGDGVVEPLTAVIEAAVLVDAAAPFISPITWLPFAVR